MCFVLLCKRVVLIFLRVQVCLAEVIYRAVILLVRLLELILFPPGQTDTYAYAVRTHTLCSQTSQRLKIKCLLNLIQQNKQTEEEEHGRTQLPIKLDRKKRHPYRLSLKTPDFLMN